MREPARLQIVDPRGRDRQLHVSWHSSRRLVVFSQWRHDVCVASTPVELAEIPAIIRLLVGALEDASTRPEPTARVPSARSVRRDVCQLLQTWLQPRLAPILAFSPRPRVGGDEPAD